MANLQEKKKFNFKALKEKLKEYRESYVDRLSAESEILNQKLEDERSLFFPVDVHKVDIREIDLVEKVKSLKELKNLEKN